MILLGDVAANQKVIQWFWETVREFEQEQKAKLLQFVTGMSYTVVPDICSTNE